MANADGKRSSRVSFMAVTKRVHPEAPAGDGEQGQQKDCGTEEKTAPSATKTPNGKPHIRLHRSFRRKLPDEELDIYSGMGDLARAVATLSAKEAEANALDAIENKRLEEERAKRIALGLSEPDEEKDAPAVRLCAAAQHARVHRPFRRKLPDGEDPDSPRMNASSLARQAATHTAKKMEVIALMEIARRKEIEDRRRANAAAKSNSAALGSVPMW